MKASSEIDIFLYKMNEIYSTALELLTATEKTNKRMKVRIFSDNILAAAPIGKRDPKTAALEVINFCRFFQTYALCKGFPVRGAITCGNFYSNEIFVYGEALVQAYEMESQRAVYPRIIIDKDICSYMTLNELQQARQNGLILDMDGELSLDFCSPCIHPGNDKLSIENLIKIRNTILSPFLLQKTTAKEKQKYCWLANRFNEFCDKNSFSIPKITMNCNNEPEPNAFYDDEYCYILNGDKEFFSNVMNFNKKTDVLHHKI